MRPWVLFAALIKEGRGKRGSQVLLRAGLITHKAAGPAKHQASMGACCEVLPPWLLWLSEVTRAEWDGLQWNWECGVVWLILFQRFREAHIL